MHLSPSLGLTRRKRRVALAARGGPLIVFAVWALGPLLLTMGCAAFGRRGAEPEKVAACRELSRRGVAAMEMGNWQQAEALMQRAVDASPHDAVAHRYLAEALWHRGAAEPALVEMETAARLDPTEGALAVRAGEMALARGAHDAALVRAERAIALDSKQAAAWALRGRVFWRLHQTDRAIADLQRALDLDPHRSDALFDMALVYRERGQSARSLAALHNLLDTYPPGEEPQTALLLEGLTLLEMGRPNQAVESLQAAAHRGPPSAEVFFRLAQAQRSAGRDREAAAAAEQALALDKSHEASRQLLLQIASGTPVAENQRR